MIKHQNIEATVPSRVVILGGSGFIGKAICKQLKQQGISFFAPSSVEVNLSEPSSVSFLSDHITPSDAVVMLAALTPDRGRDIATMMKNLIMMQHVCAALDRTGCSHLVYFSSDAVYNMTPGRVREDTPSSPQDLYGTMHLMREIMACGLTKIPVLVLRPTLVYGVDDTHNAYGPNRFRRVAQKNGEITLFGDGEDVRDHIHVKDVATLTVKCLFHRSVGTLNAVTGISKSFHEIAKIVSRQFDRSINIITTPRANPITYRYYDVINLIKAFPDFHFTSPENGIAQIHEELSLQT